MPSHFPESLDFSQLNEADVRGEIIDPMLRALGYQAGTPNNINREPVLRYSYVFLGRKKKGDHKLEGRPDYVLEVGSFGRWLVEVKAPSVTLGVDDFEQAQSYALHPSVSASLFALTNGRTFRLYQANAVSFDNCLETLDYGELKTNWARLESLIGPEGFRRHVPQVKFDKRLPVAVGFGPSIRFGAGLATPKEVRVSLPLPVESLRPLVEMQNAIPRALCERGEDGRLVIHVEFGSSSSFLHAVFKERNLTRIPMTTDSNVISQDVSDPTLFTGEFVLNIKAGEQLFDFTTWEPSPVPMDVNCYTRIDASGHLDGEALVGAYALRMYVSVPSVGLDIEAEQVGEFRLDVL